MVEGRKNHPHLSFQNWKRRSQKCFICAIECSQCDQNYHGHRQHGPAWLHSDLKLGKVHNVIAQVPLAAYLLLKLLLCVLVLATTSGPQRRKKPTSILYFKGPVTLNYNVNVVHRKSLSKTKKLMERGIAATHVQELPFASSLHYAFPPLQVS